MGTGQARAKTVTYKVELTPIARLQLHEIKDQRIRRALADRIEDLARDPCLQGEELSHELAGFRSVRAVGQTHRIIYRLEEDVIVVVVIALGKRKGRDRNDIYEVTKRLLRAGLIDTPPMRK